VSYTCLPPLGVTGQSDSQVSLFIYAVLDDGKIFEDKNEFTQKYYYVDLNYDKDRNDYYIELDYPPNVDWVEVTSK
jgi:hypothetical protein